MTRPNADVPLRVGIDARRDTQDGVGRVTSLLINALAAAPDVELHLLGGAADERRASVIPMDRAIFSAAFLSALPERVVDLSLDVYIGTQFYSVSKLPCRVLTVLHDAIPFEPNAHLPDMATLRREYGDDSIDALWREIAAFSPAHEPARDARAFYRAMYECSIDRSDVVLTVSQWSSRNLRRHFPAVVGKVSVVRLTAPAHFWSGRGPRQEAPFLMSVGKWDPRKRHLELVETFGSSELPAAGVRFVLVGDRWNFFPEYGDRLARAVRQGSDEGWLTWLPRLPDAALADLYQCAMATVLIPEDEGFGLPALEAMAGGCPIATNGRGALGEVCGGADLRLPASTPDPRLGANLKRLTDDAELRDRLSARAWRRSSYYAPKRFAEDLRRAISGR